MRVPFGHLKDERLLACYVGRRAGESPEPRTAEHLADCAQCTDRFNALAAFMEDLRAEADAETDALYSAAHVTEQRQQILRRLEQAHRSARVISFPGRSLPGGTTPSVSLAPRWVAAAAAAGLFIGFAVGGYFGPARLRLLGGPQASQSQPAMTVQRPTEPAPVVRVNAQPELIDDDAFLRELEIALERPHARELLPFDALTPRVSDIEARIR